MTDDRRTSSDPHEPYEGPDDLVAEGVARWRRQALPDGPSPLALARTLAAVRDAQRDAQRLAERDAQRDASRPKSLPERIGTMRQRIASMSRWTKMAAAAVLAFAAVGTFLIAVGGSSRVAYAEIKKQLQEARTMTYTVRMEGPTPITAKVFMKMPGRIRQEMGVGGAGGAVAVMDFEKKRGVTLVPEQKIAVVMNLDADPELFKQQESQAQPFKELLEGQKEDLGEVESGGRKSRGYRVRKDGQTLDLWVDAKTGEPHRMELPGMKISITEIRLNPELDDALFTLDVPAGYQVREMNMDLAKTTEKDLIAGLEFIAKYNDGKFPDQPAMTLDLVENLKKAASTVTKEDEARFGQVLARMMMFPAMAQQGGGKFVYAGKGKSLGDKDAAVAWWKLKGAAKYRVLYGDLRIEDAEESQLPPAPSK